jgi:hypothetical protein
MRAERERIVATDLLYSTNLNWNALDQSDGHEVVQKAAEACILLNASFALRFQNLRSLDPVTRLKERKWLLKLLDTWFYKKWNNKRNTDIQKAVSPNKKRKVDNGACQACGTSLICLNCDGKSSNTMKVFPCGDGMLIFSLVRKTSLGRQCCCPTE